MFLCFNLTRETLTTPSSGNIRAADWKLETERKYTKSWLIFTLFTKNDLQGQVDIYIKLMRLNLVSFLHQVPFSISSLSCLREFFLLLSLLAYKFRSLMSI